MSRDYSIQKRLKVDYCNICGKRSELTWDHVPPKSCMNSIPVKFNRLMDGIPEFNNYKMISQNGIRFRSLCSFCNNTLLGTEYDPELTRFTSEVVSHVRTVLEHTSDGGLDIDVLGMYEGKVRINRMLRAICGHMLAAKNEYDDQTIPDRKLREFFLDTTAMPPEDFQLHMWFYPYSPITIIRDFVVKKISDLSFSVPEGMCSIVSSFPVAYMLCDDNYRGNLDNMFNYCTTDIDEEVLIKVDFSSCVLESGRLRHPMWPAYVSDDPDGVDLLIASKYTTNSSVSGIRKLQL